MFAFITPEKPRSGTFEAKLDVAKLTRGGVARIRSVDHYAWRSKADIARIPGDFFSLGLQLAGQRQMVIKGESFVHVRDQLVLHDLNGIEQIDLHSDYRFTTSVFLRFEKSLLLKEAKVFCVLDKTYDLALKTTMTLVNERLSQGSMNELNELLDATISLLNARLISDPAYLEDDLSAHRSARRGLYATIHEHVLQHIAELSQTGIAKQFSISKRYVQKLFAEEGTTFKSFVTEMRLQRTKADLLLSNDRVSVSTIAERWGYRNMATFHRSFRKRFGDTPLQMRMQKGHVVQDS